MTALRVRDGVIDPETYLRASPRIVWLLKEFHNDDGTYPELDESLRRMGRAGRFETYWKKTFTLVARVSYHLLNNSRWSDDLDEESFVPALLSIAVINVKKVAGGAVAVNQMIAASFKEESDQLRSQIYEVKPDVVIGGNVLHYSPWLPRILSRPGKTFDSMKHDGITWINAYHPAVRSLHCTPPEYFKRVKLALQTGREG